MRRNLSGWSIVLALFVGCLANAVGAAWKEFTSKEGGFSVLMPGTPKHTKDNLPAELVQHSFMLQLDGDHVTYLVAYIDYPKPALGSADKIKKRMDVSRDGLVQPMKGKVQDEKTISLKGHPGRSFTTKLPDGGTWPIRIYAVKQRIYQLAVMNDKGHGSSKEALKFLESFTLLEK